MDSEALLIVEGVEEICWLTGDFRPLWSLIACSTSPDLRHLINAFAASVILVDRRLRDEAA